jgi:hypothetical protein
MPNLSSLPESVIRPEEAIRNRKKAVKAIREFTSYSEPRDAYRFWENLVNGFINFLDPQAVVRTWQKEVQNFLDNVTGETAETILEGLLGYMWFRFMIDSLIIDGDFRKNIENFTGRYQFCSKEDDVDVLVKFANGKMDWEESRSQDVNATLEFKDGPSLINFLINYVINNDRDILRSLTENEIRVTGNFNYLFKFLFMVNHLLLEATGELPY